jgi:hypothetical protein
MDRRQWAESLADELGARVPSERRGVLSLVCSVRPETASAWLRGGEMGEQHRYDEYARRARARWIPEWVLAELAGERYVRPVATADGVVWSDAPDTRRAPPHRRTPP